MSQTGATNEKSATSEMGATNEPSETSDKGGAACGS